MGPRQTNLVQRGGTATQLCSANQALACPQVMHVIPMPLSEMNPGIRGVPTFPMVVEPNEDSKQVLVHLLTAFQSMDGFCPPPTAAINSFRSNSSTPQLERSSVPRMLTPPHTSRLHTISCSAAAHKAAHPACLLQSAAARTFLKARVLDKLDAANIPYKV